MPEKDTIYSSKIKYTGIFNFAEFYRFTYDWLMDETQLNHMEESKYKEKIKGDAKEVEVEWNGEKKITDYFRMEIKVEFRVLGLKKIEIVQDGQKIKTNEGDVEVKVKGVLSRDYDAKFESNATKKWMRVIYEKFVIPSRINEMEGKVAGWCDEFLTQSKAYLSLEGKR